MKRPVVGVIGNAHRIENRFNVQGVGERSMQLALVRQTKS